MADKSILWPKSRRNLWIVELFHVISCGWLLKKNIICSWTPPDAYPFCLVIKALVIEEQACFTNALAFKMQNMKSMSLYIEIYIVYTDHRYLLFHGFGDHEEHGSLLGKSNKVIC